MHHVLFSVIKITSVLIYRSMERSNDSLANGLAYLVLKIVHKTSEPREYSPNLLASMLSDTKKRTRGADEVFYLKFGSYHISRYNTLHKLHAF